MNDKDQQQQQQDVERRRRALQDSIERNALDLADLGEERERLLMEENAKILRQKALVEEQLVGGRDVLAKLKARLQAIQEEVAALEKTTEKRIVTSTLCPNCGDDRAGKASRWYIGLPGKPFCNRRCYEAWVAATNFTT